MPELDDAFAKDKLGFDDVAAMRAAIAKEIGDQKKSQLPQLKESRVTGELAKRLDGKPTPEYVQTVFQELGQNFLNQLQSRGMTLDGWLAANGMQPQAFMDDLNHQATDIATESLALDALVAEKGFDCTEEDIDEEFKNSGVKDWQATKKEFLEGGRMPAVRVSIRRNKAIDWLLETANVTISDEAPADETAEPADEKKADAKAEEKAEKKPAKKTTKKTTTKKAAKAEPAAEATEAAEEKPAKKPAAKKTTTKKAAAKKAEKTDEEKAE